MFILDKRSSRVENLRIDAEARGGPPTFWRAESGDGFDWFGSSRIIGSGSIEYLIIVRSILDRTPMKTTHESDKTPNRGRRDFLRVGGVSVAANLAYTALPPGVNPESTDKLSILPAQPL